MKFLDEAKVYLRSGDGGGGCISFHRAKYVEYGGPDGGDGGRGGDIVFACEPSLNTLIDFRYRQHFRASNGTPGAGKQKTGASGKRLVVQVPPGTQVLSEDRSMVLLDVTDPGERTVFLRGGDGGRGNMRFKSSTNQAPRRADPGWPGEECWVWLRLKLIADVGLVGLPNAGKSTLLSVVSRARPRIADYPFTTLHPNLGVVGFDDDEFVMADLPGLIEGAHRGAGLGDRFLGHAERCSVLLHVVDATASDVLEDFRLVRHELREYGHGLQETTTITALNKVDALTPEKRTDVRECLVGAAGPVYEISGVSGEGVDTLMARLLSIVSERRRTAEAA